jgi:hypothetical protein
MAPSGKHDKMLILAFSDSKKAESGGTAEADDQFEALINPESYTVGYKINFSDGGQGQGTSGKQLKYENTEPADMSFEFLFDNTGLIDGEARDSISDDLKHFKKMLVDYQGDSHEPRHFKLVWGSTIFIGRVTAVDIIYKLFNADGTPIRATAKVTFKSSIEEEKRAAKEDKQSPDLTQTILVKASDTLPQLCYKVYGDPKFYLQVADRNGISNFRILAPGSRLVFPPIGKTPTAGAAT